MTQPTKHVDSAPPPPAPPPPEAGSLTDLLLSLLPYLLLAALPLLYVGLPAFDGLPRQVHTQLLGVAHWGLRLVWVSVAFYAWRAGAPWRLGWLSLALYAAVGGLLSLVFAAGDWLFSSAVSALLLGLPMLALAFAPWLIAIAWVGRRNREHALWLALPHAAATAPLFLLVVPDSPPPGSAWGIVLPLLWAGLAQTLLPNIASQRYRMLALAGAVPVGALLFLPALFYGRADWT